MILDNKQYEEKHGINKCPFCNSDDIGIGYQLGHGRIFADEYAFVSSKDCSEVEYLICRNCGSILRARVLKPEAFHPFNQVRQDKLLEFIDEHGILLCNVSRDLPSLTGLGYKMEDIMGLVDLHQVYYCTIYKGRSIYLSREVYFLLKRCYPYPPLNTPCRLLLKTLKKLGAVEKVELKKSVEIDHREFEREFSFLLKNLYITAFSRGRRLNPNWYTYRYCISEQWEKEIHGLHFSGDPRKKLVNILRNHGGIRPEEIKMYFHLSSDVN